MAMALTPSGSRPFCPLFWKRNPTLVDIAQFVDRFVTYEERTDEDGAEHTETHTVAAPIVSLEKNGGYF